MKDRRTFALAERPSIPLPTEVGSPLEGHFMEMDYSIGEVYVSEDADESWRKIAREFGEIRTAAWLPH